MASKSNNNKDIRYLSKDFSDLKTSLIEYAKAYYPNTYNDFSTSSPGSMFIDMAAYVGDIMSFYLDNQIQENFLQYAKQKDNIMTMAYMLGYRPKVTSAATTTLDVYQILPAINPGTGSVPDWKYSLILEEGMQVSSYNNVKYYIPENIDFSVSSSANPTEISVYETADNKPTKFLLKKRVSAVSGEVKTTTVAAPTTRAKFFTTVINDTEIIEILDVTDSDGNKWYEVPYLAQSTILHPKKNTIANDPNYHGSSLEVPYLLEVLDVPRRFVTRFRADDSLELQFGAGREDISPVSNDQEVDQKYLPDPKKVGMGTIDGTSLIFTSYNPANFVNTRTYGISPYNTTLTIKYLKGGGAKANVGSNQIVSIVNYTSSFYGGVTSDQALEASVLQSLAINNPSASSGGGDGDSIEEIRMNALANFPTQQRAVTEEDYLATVYSLPAKFGQVAKAYVTSDDFITNKQLEARPELRDSQVISTYVLSYDSNKNLVQPPAALMHNLKTYVSNFRLLTDSVHIKPAYIINIGVDFDIIIRPNYQSREVIANCIQVMKDYFNIDNWGINQPIIKSDVYTALDKVEGVQTVKKLDFYNLSDADGNYSKFGYDIAGATLNGVIYPSLDPSCFEIKYPDQDIYGRVVTY